MKRVIVFIVILNLISIIIIPSGIMISLNIFKSNQYKIDIYNINTEEYMNLDLDEYLKGVVAAEMPAGFEIEALKAQAVAARTYTLKKLKSNNLTTNSNRDQAWLSKEELKKRWGNRYIFYWAKISAAVEETKGLVLMYDNKLISAVYHSSSGDYTEDAVAVWGNSVPYLKSVPSNYEQLSPYYSKDKFYSIKDVCRVLDVQRSDINNIEIIERSSSKRVLKLKIGSRVFTGRELRQKLGLPSTNFIIKKEGEFLKFKTSGYGHGVGMSQYGANGMAKNRYNFKEILSHYYPHTQLKIFW
ncbi:stage II sporulation protein D [Orenia metallireducens]|uniref:Stage II sporulation protein D n=1 Tax=Orenia metallireducens TaxID=1413210 RepID=A0A285GKU6_9FIRM|nr:stage II sporulation protein D [Orenia metallireducens]PRX35753.1 stage II sporulation protein D [Orenia metallireducens]SNY24197.1 stage II sporulation protein D [Orenia metallireducens]